MHEGSLLAARFGGVAIGFPLLTWAIGAAFLGRFTRLDRAERFAASFGLGFAAVALCAFLALVLHAPQPYFNLGAVGLLLAVALLCRLTKPKSPADIGPSVRPLAIGLALAYLHLVCIQALLPAYRGSNWYFDWWMHYDEACVFVGDKPVNTEWANSYTLASRTPLFNLTTAFVMGLAGHDFAIYQLASVLPSICFVLVLYLLLRELFGRRAGRLALLLAPLNLWMLHNAWFTWPKMLAAYYLILALYFYLRSLRYRASDPSVAAGYFISFGVAALLGFMTHQVGLVYVLPLLLHAGLSAWRNPIFRPRSSELIACGLMGLVVAAPWYVWLASTLGRDKITGSTPITLGDTSARFNPLAIANWMGCNLGASVVPLGIGRGFLTEKPLDADVPPWSVEVYQAEKRWFFGPPTLVGLYRGVTELYFSLFTGAITISLLVFLIAIIRRRRRESILAPLAPAPADSAVWSAVWFFLVGGTLGSAFLHPGRIAHGIAHSAAFPSALVLAALAWGLLSRARTTVAVLVGCGMVLEFVLMFWSHWWLLLHNSDVLEPGSGVDGPREALVPLWNEILGRADSFFLAGAILVQALLIVLLLRSLHRQMEPAK
jgi:hypothetical protein